MQMLYRLCGRKTNAKVRKGLYYAPRPLNRTLALFKLAHISDLHLPMDGLRLAPRDYLSKRALNYLSWQRRRRHRHLPAVLTSLIEDLRSFSPDHVAVTGDLTNLSLATEVSRVAPWLARLGAPSDITVVPGNHDALLAPPASGHLSEWGDWMTGDEVGAAAFPWVRQRGPVALVAVSTAVPTPPLLASGRIGGAQLERLRAILADLGKRDVCRIVLMHHPPTPGSWRKGLSDRDAFRRVIAACGAELILHGHTHRATFAALPGPAGPVPVISVPSASAKADDEAQAARWHLLTIDPAGGGWSIAVTARRLQPDGGFRTIGQYRLAVP